MRGQAAVTPPVIARTATIIARAGGAENTARAVTIIARPGS